MNTTQTRIIKLQTQDLPAFKQLIQLFGEVFEEEQPPVASDAYLEKLLGRPGFVAIAILNGPEVIGGLTAYEMPLYYAEYSEMYIYDVAIKATFQRRGLGKQLIDSLKEYCSENGIRAMFVEAHAEDAHAVDFYRSTGASAEKVVHFNYEIG